MEKEEMLIHGDRILFFQNHPGALPLYLTLEERICREIPVTRIQVKSSQISFYNRHMFACASFARVKKASELPRDYLVVTFGMPYRVEDPRIAAATEPYPNRWTHHVVLTCPEEVDRQFLDWIAHAAEFSQNKR